MSIKTLPLLPDRYFFRSRSDDTRVSSKKKLDTPSPTQRKRYKFTSTNTERYPNVYKFPTNPNETRSHSSGVNPYYFSVENTTRIPSQSLTYRRSGNGFEQRSAAFIEGSSTIISDPTYRFSPTKYPSSISTFPILDDTCTSRQRKPPRSGDNSLLRTRSITPEHRPYTRMDTVTSTNGSLSIIRRSPAVHFKSSSLSPTARSYLNEARERLSGRRGNQLPESLEKSVDRLVSSINKKYGQQSSLTTPSTSSSSSKYISQYYAKEDERTFESDDEQQKFSYNLNINRTHTQIMKTVNKSLIDRTYQVDRNRLKHFEQNIHRYLRLFESQSLQRELNYNLIRCFSSSYLQDIRQEEIRQDQIRSQMRSYTYEDMQDIHVPSILEAYKMKLAIDREKHHRLQSSISTGPLSPNSSSGYSPIMIGSLNENMDTQSGGFGTDRKSMTSTSQISPSVDVFYEIMQESFRNIDASIAGHISKVSKSSRTIRDLDSDIEIKSNSSFWSDEEHADYYHIERDQRKSIPNQRKISRYLSAVNRSLLDRPSDLITDFYLSQLNRNMQESVRHMEIIARDKAYQQEFLYQQKPKLGRSLSAEHLYQVRKEHLRYKQPFIRPTSFTAEDVADIYKPFVLDSYKRKIAIELERRRRKRQERLISTSFEAEMNKPFHRPRTCNEFGIVSPPIIVQTKEIIMGRARRTLTNDGSSNVVHHISGVLPPPIFSINKGLISMIDPPDFGAQNRDDQSIITSHRPYTKIYTHASQINRVEICHANRIEPDSDGLSMVKIEPIVALHQYEVNSLSDHSYDGQVTQYIEDKPHPERSTLVISLDEHVSRMHEVIPITELIRTTDISIPSSDKAHEISADSGISLNVSQTKQPPTIFHSPYTQVTTEPLPEIGRTSISNDIPDIDPSHDSVPLASLFEELTSAIHKQHAKQIIDENYYWKTCEKVEENVRIPIIVYNTEWKDEQVEEFLPSNIQNAHYKYPETIQYERVKIDQPYCFAFQSMIDNDEQVTSLSTDPYPLGQLTIQIDLEHPVRSTNLLTFNYPHHNQNISLNSQSSSLREMETFLTNFEESIDHEQHLPFVNQISVSYAASIDERKELKYRSLPIEWFQPILRSHDEQLVEQWTVENNLDTIQHEGTLHRHQVDFLTNTECENVIFASTTDAFCINERFEEEKSNNTSLRENNDMISHCSPTSDYETDSVEKDNDTLIIPLTILPSSSITNPTLLSQSSPLLTSHTAPIAPIVYFLDVLALEQKETNTSTKDFLLTIGFGQNQMNEITNTVATTDQPLRPTWISRSLSDDIEVLPTSIHHENQSIAPVIHQQLQFAVENQIEDDDTALLIYPHRLQFGHDLGDNIQAPLSTFFEPPYLRVPITSEIYKYQMSFHTEFPFFYPPNALPHILVSKIQDDEILSPDECQINQPTILAYAQIDYSVDNREETQAISIKLDQPSYIEHYHIQSLFPFPETCYAKTNEIEILADQNHLNDFLANFILTKPIKSEDDDLLKRFKRQNTDNDQIRSKQFDSNIIKSKPTVGGMLKENKLFFEHC